MAAVWKGSLSFGLVGVPVELRAAVRSSRPHFRLLHVKDQSPIRYERVCQREGKAVAWDDLVKGYEYEKGKFVVLGKDDFETAALERSTTLEILDFVDADAVDDRYFETAYYAVPQKGGGRGYAVLREAIRDSGKIGIGKIVLRQSQHLAALTAVEDALVVTLMRFADELVDVSRFDFPPASAVRPKEREMARALVKSLAAPWEPERYTDEYRANLMRVIAAKAKGKTVTLEEEHAPREGKVVDLMERLRQSLDARGPARARGAKRTRKRKKTTRRRSRTAA